MKLNRVVVTGGSGKAGRAVVTDLVGQGLDVLNVDVAASRDPDAPTRIADLTDLGQAVEVLRGAEKNIVRPGHLTTGDLIGVVNPSPVTVRALTLVFALRVDRNALKRLSPEALIQLEGYLAECQQVLKGLSDPQPPESGLVEG